jgi:large subunit ribosomal protein L13
MIDREIHKIDATGQAIGRLATQVATLLRGKNKATYQPHLDEGDVVYISNIRQVVFTGKKLEQKNYYRHSGYPGGLKTLKMLDLQASQPDQVLRRAVKQMLPANRLRDGMLKRLIIN